MSLIKDDLFLFLPKNLEMKAPKNVEYYCSECLHYLNSPKQTNCSTKCSLNRSYRSFSNVVELSINDVREEIIVLVEKYSELLLDYISRSNQLPCDVVNSQIYHDLSTTISSRKNQIQITLMLHTDGAPITKVNGKSLWPVQASLCEIPPPIRDHQHATIVLGAYLGKHHPDRNLLWDQIVNQLQNLFNEELTVTINQNTIRFSVRVQLITFDLPALAMNCNIIQYNGYKACPFCQINGESIDRQVFYPYSSTEIARKTVDHYRQYGKKPFESHNNTWYQRGNTIESYTSSSNTNSCRFYAFNMQWSC